MFVREQKERLNTEMRPLINEFAPALIEMKGVGYDTAAKLLIVVGDNPHRIRSEACMGTPLRRGADPGLVGQDPTPPPEPAEPPSELGDLPDHAHSHGQ